MRKFIIIIISMFVCAAGLVAGGNTYAASDISLDNTNIITDLADFDINAQEININDYEFDDNKNLEIINFAEFGYAYRINQQNNYNLYVYIYNPKDLEISKNSIMNKLQMSVNSNDYNKYSLRYCSDLNNLIYKFKLLNATDILDTLNEDITADRVYSVSGIELKIDDDVNATEFDLAKTFKYSGFAQGYGENVESESSLYLDVKELETITLDVQHTNYRTATSAKGAGYQNEINSVYFSVPNQILYDYGALQKILAEWWEYKTAPIIVTNNNTLYNDFKDFIAVSSKSASVPDNYRLYSGLSGGSNQDNYNWAWNVTPGMYSGKVVTVEQNIDKFYYLFKSADDVTKAELANYIYNYNKSYNNGTLPIKDNTISADLFSSSVEDGRTRGYNVANIDAGDEFDLLSYGDSHSFWQTFLDFGFLAPELGEDIEGVSPIYQVRASDLLNTDSNVANNLLIKEDDVTAFKAYYQAEKNNDNSVFLFRYAVTDYFSKGVNAVSDSGGIFGEAYRAEQSIFFDFDIIQLTFNKNDVYSIIPVVSNPQDIINEVTPPQEEAAWIGDALRDWFNELTDGWAANFKKIAMIVAAVLLLLLLWPVLPYIIKLIGFIVLLPYRFIKWIIKSIKKAVNNSKAD